MKLIANVNRGIVNIFIIFLILTSNIFSYKNLGRIFPSGQRVEDTSSIYSPSDAVDLLINISKKVCTKATSSTVTVADFDNILIDCLNNLKNEAVTFENNLKNFWNVATDYIKTSKSEDSKKKVDTNLIEGMFNLVKNHRVKVNAYHGSSCYNMMVMSSFNQATVLSEIESYLSKFNLGPRKDVNMLTSAIGVHRNLADPRMFAVLNGAGDTKPMSSPNTPAKK